MDRDQLSRRSTSCSDAGNALSNTTIMWAYKAATHSLEVVKRAGYAGADAA